MTAWIIRRRDAAADRWIDALSTTTPTPTRATQRRERRAQRRLRAWDAALTLLASHRRR